MRQFYGSIASIVLLAAGSQAMAQSADFRGFRIEGQIGDDRFHSQGAHDDKLGWGVAGGYDGVFGGKVVIGPEFSYWHGGARNVTPGLTGGTITARDYRELGAAVRAGYLVTPRLLAYGIGGYVNGSEGTAFSGIGATGAGGFVDRGHVDGYQLGGGLEYSLTRRFYVSGGYRYSNYDNHTSRERAFLGAGVRF
jgi:outer membrane immunogenic protein